MSQNKLNELLRPAIKIVFSLAQTQNKSHFLQNITVVARCPSVSGLFFGHCDEIENARRESMDIH